MAKRRKSVRRRKAVANPRRRVARRRPAVRRRRRAVANPAPRRRRRVSRRRTANPRRASRRSYSRRRRNPISVFGSSGSKDLLSMVGGGLVGVAAAKFIPNTLASSLSGVTGGMGKYGGLVLTGIAAWAAGWAATKFVNPTFGSAVLFGGLMQTGSVALNLFMPGFTVGGVPLGLSGMGEFVPGQFAVPQNPLRLPAAPAPAARVEMNGLNRAYGRAF